MLWRRLLASVSVSTLMVVATPAATTPDGSNNVVNLGYSTYQGTSLPIGVTQYLGLRYAAPPTSDLRWRAPADPLQTITTQDATSFGPLCLGTGDAPTSKHSEDCLFINVYTPTSATETSKLPVWLYIQGGGYAMNSNADYNGTQALVASNYGIVLVNFNYRVGAWGFLASEHVRADGDLNAGLLDQRKAMQWVRKYIARFGGDPDHVVLHGSSAGAGSVAHHLAAYGGRDDGLFAGVVVESPFWPIQRTVAETAWQFERFAASLDWSTAEDVMACLRAKSTAELQAANVVEPFPGREGKPHRYWTPVVDGNFSTGLLYDAFTNGKIVRVPTLVGDDTNEGSLFAADASTSAEFLDFVQDNFPSLTDSDLQDISATYPLMAALPQHAAWFPSSSAAYGDSTFTCPGNHITASIARAFSHDQVWDYQFDAAITVDTLAGVGVPHTSETSAIFGPPNNCWHGDGCSFATYNAPLVPLVMGYYISFVKSLDPNAFKEAAAPVWEPWGPQGYEARRLRIALGTTAMETVPKSQAERCAMWLRLAGTMEQ